MITVAVVLFGTSYQSFIDTFNMCFLLVVLNFRMKRFTFSSLCFYLLVTVAVPETSSLIIFHTGLVDFDPKLSARWRYAWIQFTFLLNPLSLRLDLWAYYLKFLFEPKCEMQKINVFF